MYPLNSALVGFTILTALTALLNRNSQIAAMFGAEAATAAKYWEENVDFSWKPCVSQICHFLAPKIQVWKVFGEFQRSQPAHFYQFSDYL